jgi:PPM family protein phosphatase
MQVLLNSFGQTDVGLKRQKNEDSFLIDDSVGLYLVADGMGGHKGGDLASSMAVDIMQSCISLEMKKNPTQISPRDLLIDGYLQASQQIFHKSHVDQPELQGMGTTLVCGDKMWQLTEDHSLLNEHIRAGFIRDNDIAQFQAKNVITRSVGFEREALCDVIERRVEVGDRYLMCSDGLSGLVTPERLLEICRTPNKLQDAVNQCIEEAKANGGDDNITVLMIDAVAN